MNFLRHRARPKGRLSIQVAGYWFASAVPLGFSFLSVPVFTRLVSAEDYGRYSLVVASVGVVVTLAAGWAEYAVVRVLPEQKDTWGVRAVMRTVRRLTLLAAIAVAAMTLVSGFVAARRGWLPSEFIPYLLPSACVLAARPLFQIFRVAYQALGASERYAVYEVFQAGLAFLLGVALVGGLRWGMPGRLWAEAGVLTLLALAASLALGHATGSEPPANSVGEEEIVRRVLLLGLPIAGWSAGLNIMSAWERGLLRVFGGDSVVGAYGAVFAIVERTSWLLFTPLLMATFPRLVRLWHDEGMASAAKALRRSMVWYGVLALVYMVLGLAFGRPAITALLPPAYTGGLSVVPWLLGAFVVWHFAMYVHKGLELGERTWLMLVAMMLALVIFAIASLLLVPLHGMQGLAGARLVGSVVYLLVVLRPSHAVLPWFWRSR